MNSEIRNYINQIAEVIANDWVNQTTNRIINLDQLVINLGGTIINDSNLSFYDGIITKIGDRQFEIRIASHSSEERKRFTIAHELGHLFIHMGYIVNDVLWQDIPVGQSYQRGDYNETEYGANEIAAGLLMPISEFKRIIYENHQNGYFNIRAIADYFNVSEQAAINRGRWLGVFSWE